MLQWGLAEPASGLQIFDSFSSKNECQEVKQGATHAEEKPQRNFHPELENDPDG
jgi:hypothetical protein